MKQAELGVPHSDIQVELEYQLNWQVLQICLLIFEMMCGRFGLLGDHPRDGWLIIMVVVT